MSKLKLFFMFAIACVVASGYGRIQHKESWWLEEPYRLIQTNLREIDAIDFDIDVYVESLKDIGANAVLINVGGIVANYYTDLEFHYRNPNLKFDLIEEVIQRLHEENIRVIGRFDFSKLNEAHAAENPDWHYKSHKGATVNYNGQVHMCVNGGYQQEYALKILDEALTKFPLDGVFFNMSGYQVRDYSHNYIGICQSGACKKRFKEWSGGLGLPTVESVDDPVFIKYKQFKEETASESYMKRCDLIKSYGDHIAILNYNKHGTDFYRLESQSHGSLYNQIVPWEYSASSNVKRVLGSYKNKQASNASVHFYGYPARHSSDSQWVMQKRLVGNILHGGGLDFYCIGRLDNLEDSKSLEGVKKVYRFHEENEDVLSHTLSKNRVLVLRQKGKEYEGLFEILSENHILFDVMEHDAFHENYVPRALSSYELVVLPDVQALSDEQCLILDQYVNGGGRLLASGFTSTKDELGNPMKKVRLKSLGVKPEYNAFEREQGTYYRVFEKDKQKLGSERFAQLDLVFAWERGLLCEPVESAEGLLGFIPPAMIGPPEKCYYEEVTDIPGLVHNRFGKGEAVFITFRLGALYHHKRHRGHSAIVISAIENLLGYEKEITTNASPLVELNRRYDAKRDFEWVGLLNHSGQLGGGFFEPLALHDIELSFTSEKKVKSVRSLVSGESIPFKINADGEIKLGVTVLNDFDFVLLEY